MKKVAAVVAAMAAAVGALALFREMAKPLRVLSPQYANIQSNGVPFTTDGVIDAAKARRLARHDLVTLEPAREGPALDVERIVRAGMGPRGKLLAYVSGGSWFKCGFGWKPGDPLIYGCDTSGSDFAWARMVAIRAHDAILWNTAGALHENRGYVDWAKPGVAAALADTCAAWVATSGLYNGVFVDELSYSILWTDKPESRIDYSRSGYASLAAWDAAYRAGVETFLRRLRKRLPPRSTIGVNFGGAYWPARPTFVLPALVDFAMWENFPYQHGVTVADYLAADTTYAMGVWLTAWSDGNPQTAEAQRRHRYVAGVAMLGDRGFGGLVGRPDDHARGFIDWTPPTWDTGKPTGKAVHSGSTWTRNFERGVLVVNEATEAVEWRAAP